MPPAQTEADALPEMDEDARSIALGFVRGQGAAAVQWLLEMQKEAAVRGDHASADTWGEIAEAAASILAEHHGSVG